MEKEKEKIVKELIEVNDMISKIRLRLFNLIKMLLADKEHTFEFSPAVLVDPGIDDSIDEWVYLFVKSCNANYITLVNNCEMDICDLSIDDLNTIADALYNELFNEAL